MLDPFIAIDAATDLRSHARALRRAWEAVLGGAEPTGDVRPLIEASWRRTERAGVDPDRPAPRRAFDRGLLADHRAASGLADCVDAMRTVLGGFAADAEHVMVVTDAECRILWLEGDPRVRHRAERITFEEGMSWTEASVGTNAIGTARAIDHAVQVFSAEHFSAKQHPWWCSAAPIHDPGTGAVVGVVDLSGPMRTAHPHSLALVSAAARMAEELLRSRRALEDERLRRRYVEHTLGTGRRAAGLVAADGRVLHAETAALAVASVDVPPGGGPVLLAGGAVAVAEPLDGGRGHILWDAGRTRAAPPAALRLTLLGGEPRAAAGSRVPVELGLRHAEVLCILALHPEGLSAEELTAHLYGPGGNVVSTRAELSRLRRLLPGVVGARPYRLTAAVAADVLDVQRALERGDAAAALQAHHAPLLPGSGAPRVRRARAELEAGLRRAAVAGSLGGLWAWLQGRSGREDAEALAAFVRRAEPRDPRRAAAAARLRALRPA